MPDSLPQQLKNTVSDIWSFLKSPQDKPVSGQHTSEKFKALLWVLGIHIVLSALLGTALWGLSKTGWYSSDNHAIANMMREQTVYTFLFMGIIVLPLIEEVLFRYGLRFKKGYITFIVILLLAFCGALAFALLPLVGALLLMVLLIMVFAAYILNADFLFNYLRQVWPRIYAVVFYTIAVLFGLIHIANYTGFDYTSAAILLVPVLIAPQIIGGLLIGYTRVKHGFSWGFYQHAGHNAFFFITSLLLMNAVEEKLNITNENYTLKIEEHMLLNPTAGSASLIGPDSVFFENQKLHDVILALIQQDKSLVEFDNSANQSLAINLIFKNLATKTDTARSQDLIIQNKAQILQQLQEHYNFSITYRRQELDAWDFTIEDSSLLAAHAVTDTGTSKIKYNKEDITLENATINDLLLILQQEFKIFLPSDRQSSATKEKYNFKLARKTIGQLQEDLKATYGLNLYSRMEVADKAIVKFSN